MISASPAYLTANANPIKKPIFVITISGYSKAFSNAPLTGTIGGAAIYDWLVGMEDHQVTVNDLDGGCDLSDFIFTVQDGSPLTPGAITADFPSFTFEGKTAQLLQGFAGMVLADYATLLTFRIESVESVTSNLEYTFSCPDILADLAQTIYGTGDDGLPTSSSDVRTLLGHPLDILIAALETECGYLSSQVDETKIIAYRDGIYSGALMQFSLDAAPTAKDFIESEIMKPLGMYLRTNNLGQITIESFYPLVTATVMDFNPGNLFAIPMVGQADLINEVVLRMDDSSGSTFTTESVLTYAPSITRYGLYGQQTIEAKGLRSGLNGLFVGGVTAFLIFLRYGMKALCCGDNGKNSSSDPIDAWWNTALVEPGDLVTMTHPQVPDRDLGVIGITGKAFVVMDRTWQFFAGHVQYKLIEVNLAKLTEFAITSDGEAAYTSASSGDEHTLMFLCNDADQYSNGDPANTLS